MLSVKNLVKVYRRKGGAVRALDDVSLALPARGLVVVTGKRGAGKSALLDILGGVDVPDGGELIADGKSYLNCAQSALDDYRHTKVALVAPSDDLIEGWSAARNVELALRMHGKKKAAADARRLLASVGYNENFDSKPYALSEGQKRLVSLARAAAKDRAAIIADDPTAGMSEEEGEQVFETLKRLSADRLVVATARDRATAEKYGDRVVELDGGKIVADSGETRLVKTAAPKPDDGSRARLPLRLAARLGAGAIKCKPLRLLLTLVIGVIAFGSFGVFNAMATYDLNAAAVSALTGTGYNAALLCKKYVVREHTTKTEYVDGRLIQSFEKHEKTQSAGIPASEVGKYDSAKLGVRSAGVFGFGGSQGLGVNVTNIDYSYFADDDIGYPVNGGIIYDYSYNGSDTDGFTDAGEQYLKDVFGEDVCLVGAYPQAADEVAIGEYLYEEIAANGLLTFDAESGKYGETVAIDSLADVVGKRLVVSGSGVTDVPLTITGVYRTGKPDVAHDRPANPYDNGASGIFERAMGRQAGFHRLLYVADCFYDAHVDKTAEGSIVVLGNNYAECHLTEQEKGTHYGHTQTSFVFPEKLISCGDYAVCYAFDDGSVMPAKALADLDDKETLISVTTLIKRAMALIGAYKEERSEDGAYKKTNYENPALEEACERLSLIGGDAGQREEDIRTVLLALDTDWREWVLENTSYGSDKRIEADKVYFNYGSDTLTIEGVYDVRTNFVGDRDAFVFTRDFVEDYCYAYRYEEARAETNYVAPSDCKYAAVITPMPTNADTLKYLIGLNKPIANDSFYELTGNAIYERALNVDRMGEQKGLYVLLASLAFSFIAALLIFNYISASIAGMRHEIGVLRSLGARGSVLFKIFFTECVVIALICATLAIGGAAIACLLINVAVTAPLTGLNLLSFSFVNALAVLGISLTAAALGAFLPVWLAAQKTPVETIRAL